MAEGRPEPVVTALCATWEKESAQEKLREFADYQAFADGCALNNNSMVMEFALERVNGHRRGGVQLAPKTARNVVDRVEEVLKALGPYVSLQEAGLGAMFDKALNNLAKGKAAPTMQLPDPRRLWAYLDSLPDNELCPMCVRLAVVGRLQLALPLRSDDLRKIVHDTLRLGDDVARINICDRKHNAGSLSQDFIVKDQRLVGLLRRYSNTNANRYKRDCQHRVSTDSSTYLFDCRGNECDKSTWLFQHPKGGQLSADTLANVTKVLLREAVGDDALLYVPKVMRKLTATVLLAVTDDMEFCAHRRGMARHTGYSAALLATGVWY